MIFIFRHATRKRSLYELFRYTCWAGVFDDTCIDDNSSEILDVGLACGSGYTCPDGYSCDARANGVNSIGESDRHVKLNYGVTGYYDIWHAMLQVLRYFFVGRLFDVTPAST